MMRALSGVVCLPFVLACLGCAADDGAPAHAAPGGATSGQSGAGGMPNGGGGGASGGASGAATCAAPRLTCAGACIDVASNDQNCGACGVACLNGKHCALGKCDCSAGQMACGDSCVDVMTSAQHCGACGMACPTDGVCKAGHCAASDGCGGPAHDISIAQVVAYQTVAIPLLKDGKEIAKDERNADIVADRELFLRVFVTPGAGATPREISARLHVVNDGVAKDIFVKSTPQGPSSISALGSTFNLTVPRELVKTTTQYSVELAECGETQGTQLTPRFPATGETALAARETGKLKLHLIPVHVGNQEPDISSERLAYFKTYFEAMYPITDFELDVGDVYPLNNQPNFDNLLDDMRDVRVQESPQDDVYYVALSPLPSSDGFADGIGFETSEDDPDYRVAVSTSSDDAEYTSLVTAHEVGHNQGLPHSPGCDAGDPDGDYPYAQGKIGVWGFDRRKKVLVDPDETFDIMAYCEPVWFSDYTYQQVVTRVAHVNNKPHIAKGALTKHDFRVLLVAADGGTRWGKAYTGRTPGRAPELATVLDAHGNALASVNVYRIPTDSRHSTSVVVPEPAPGWASIQLPGGTVVSFE
jgi:hypothetical protein